MSGLDKVLLLSDALPVVLGIAALILTSYAFPRADRKYRKLLLASAVSMFLLVIAQTSWAISYLVYADFVGKWWSDRVWSVFNVLTAVISLMIAKISLTKN